MFELWNPVRLILALTRTDVCCWVCSRADGLVLASQEAKGGARVLDGDGKVALGEERRAWLGSATRWGVAAEVRRGGEGGNPAKSNEDTDSDRVPPWMARATMGEARRGRQLGW